MKVYNLENIKSATELKHRTEVISMNERSIIVLDTFTGIAQKLQVVSISLFHLDIEKVMNQLQDFENDCGNWLDNLLSSEMQKAEAAKEIKVHIDQISRLCNENPNIIDDHEIMAHGAMISSLILSHYLEECTKKNFILNSCHFMRLGLDRKPDIKYVKKNVEELMKACPDVPILITQSRLCKNAYDEVDFFPQIGNEYYATVIGAVFHADEIITSLRSDEICFQGMEHTRTLTYGEAENFIDSGIALLHPECIPLARTVGMAIVLIKTPEDTLRISSEKTGTKVKAAVSRRGVVFVKLRSLGVLTSYLFIGKVFDVFEKYKVPVYLATSSNVSVSLAVKCSNDTLRLIYRELHKYAEIGMETEMSVVSVIGDLNWEKHTGLEARIIETLKEMPVCMISYGSSTHNLSVLVREQDREKALMTLCKAFLDIPSEKFDVIKQTQLQDSFVM